MWVSKRIVSQLFFAPRRGILFMTRADWGRRNIKKAHATCKAVAKAKNWPVIVELINKGYSPSMIRSEFNIDYNYVVRAVNEYGTPELKQKLKDNIKIQKAAKGDKISQTKLAKLDYLYEEIEPLILKGYSSGQISKSLKRDPTTINKITKRLGTDKIYQQLKENSQQRIRQTSINNNIKFAKCKVSKCERLLHNVVLKYYANAIPSYPLKTLKGRCRIIDIAILEHKLAVEYDGAHWHNDPLRDEQRDKDLLDVGWRTLRLRYDYMPTQEDIEQRFLTEVKRFIS